MSQQMISSDCKRRERILMKLDALFIDFHPSAVDRICFIELLDIYAYTYESASAGIAEWTPMMFRLRDVLYSVYDRNITAEEKLSAVGYISEPNATEDFVEFLYLVGPAWNWGKNGLTNAVFCRSPFATFSGRFSRFNGGVPEY
jgi:hypothetical protein